MPPASSPPPLAPPPAGAPRLVPPVTVAVVAGGSVTPGRELLDGWSGRVVDGLVDALEPVEVPSADVVGGGVPGLVRRVTPPLSCVVEAMAGGDSDGVALGDAPGASGTRVAGDGEVGGTLTATGGGGAGTLVVSWSGAAAGAGVDR